MLAARCRAYAPHRAALSTRRSSVLSFLSAAASRERLTPPPPLPPPSTLRVAADCELQYVDLRPSSRGPLSKTFVLLHGAPGTYNDYRYLIPSLQREAPDARIISLNQPGFGDATVETHRLVHIANTSASTHLTLQALQTLCAEEPSGGVFLVGHSFGGHAAMDIAAVGLDGRLKVDGIVLLASAGTRPHRVLRPRASALAVQLLSSSARPRVSQELLASLVKFVYTSVLGFKADFPASHYVAGVIRAGTTDFSRVKRSVELLHAAAMPTLSAWSADDEFMEDAVPTALAERLGSSRRLAFSSAGHNLQKTRAAILAAEIALWADAILLDPKETPPKGAVSVHRLP
ncbi:hypothetical protein P43SY_007993 [Pythium insidiosum]|uniref:AB hydrolase-1 domain-containing protein n=1 Tax=Pythium insidiosum TaxID=114742 RepID=A0AAD5M944_PYTIN|nr:hypothetical protein P43SY_007993 [Pythium insidiosum]